MKIISIKHLTCVVCWFLFIYPTSLFAYDSSMEVLATKEAELIPPGGGEHHSFGTSVAISGNTVVIGDSDNNSVYVYVRSDNSWTLQAKFNPQDAKRYFGREIAISGDTIVVGEYDSVYIYTRSGSLWSLQTRLKSPQPEMSYFGNVVSISGDTILVGDYKRVFPYGSYGYVYVFVRSGSSWSLEDIVEPRDVPCSIDISGSTAVIGGYWSSSVYERSNYRWIKQAELEESCDVAVSSNTIVLGDIESGSQPSSVYVYERSSQSGPSWDQRTELVNPNGSPDFGQRVAISLDTLVVKSEESALVYMRSDTEWKLQDKIHLEEAIADQSSCHYMSDIDVTGNSVAFGAPVIGCFDQKNSGAAYVYRAYADVQAPTTPTNLSATAMPGRCISLSWVPPSDNIGVAGYRIYRDNVEVATSSTTGFVDSGLEHLTSYSYTIRAYDFAGNESPMSESINVKTIAGAIPQNHLLLKAP